MPRREITKTGESMTTNDIISHTLPRNTVSSFYVLPNFTVWLLTSHELDETPKVVKAHHVNCLLDHNRQLLRLSLFISFII